MGHYAIRDDKLAGLAAPRSVTTSGLRAHAGYRIASPAVAACTDGVAARAPIGGELVDEHDDAALVLEGIKAAGINLVA